MSTLVIGIPHAGIRLPPEVAERMRPHVDTAFLRSQSDAWTDAIYDVPWARKVIYPWSRILADPNRAEDQRTEGGVLPTADFDERPLYREGHEPGIHDHHVRVLTYHRPYHDRVATQVADPRTRFYVDAHSMMAVAPVRSPDFGLPRPDAVLGNRPSSKMNDFEIGPERCCPDDLTEHVAERLRHWLTSVPAPPGPAVARPEGSVTLNDPFAGGYGVATHAHPDEGVPGLQVELNQRLWVDPDGFVPIPGRIEWMAEVVAGWLEEVVGVLDQPGHRLPSLP